MLHDHPSPPKLAVSMAPSVAASANWACRWWMPALAQRSQTTIASQK